MAGKRRPSSPKQFKDELLKRTQSARVMSGMDRDGVVEALVRRTGQKLTVETYKKWETRTPIPHMWIIPFCDIVHTDPYMLLTGVPFRIGRSGEEIARPLERPAQS
jgi:hypothetical protein